MGVQRILIDHAAHEARWLLDTRPGQDLLSRIHGSENFPQCLCTAAGIGMSVRRSGNYYFLARLPGTGHLHHPDCPSYATDSFYSGLSHYPAGVVTDACNGRSLVRLAPASPPTDHNSLQMSLTGLLHLLLADGELNRWTKGQPSSWAYAAHAIRRAAQFIDLAPTGPLDARLLVPDPYDRDNPSANDDALVEFLASQNSPKFVLAPFKQFDVHEKGGRLSLKHLARTRFWLPHTDFPLPPVGGEPPLYGLVLLEVRAGWKPGNVNVIRSALTLTDRHFLPCASSAIAATAERLRQQAQSFLRPLRFDAPESEMQADFALIYGDRVEPAFLVGAACPESRQKKALATTLRRYYPVTVFDSDRPWELPAP